MNKLELQHKETNKRLTLHSKAGDGLYLGIQADGSLTIINAVSLVAQYQLAELGEDE